MFAYWNGFDNLACYHPRPSYFASSISMCMKTSSFDTSPEPHSLISLSRIHWNTVRLQSMLIVCYKSIGVQML